MLVAPMLMMMASLAAPDDAADLKAMQGAWKVVGGEFNGEPAPAQLREKLQFSFKDETLTLIGPIAADPNAGDKPEFPQLKFVLDAKASPKGIDFTILNGPKKGDTGKGIYELDGDTLKLCFTNGPMQDRPKEFKAPAGSQVANFTLERDKSKK